MEPITGGNALERGLHVLERYNDPELVEAYKRYMQRLEELVGRDNLDTYTLMYQRHRQMIIRDTASGNPSPEEQAVRDKVVADPEVEKLYEAYMELAKAHGIADSHH
jgi:hypothetical protein